SGRPAAVKNVSRSASSGSAGSSVLDTTASWSSRTASLTLLDPTLTTSTFTAAPRPGHRRGPGSRRGPGPARDRRQVSEVLTHVALVLVELRLAEVEDSVRALGPAPGPAERLLGQVEPAHPVEHHHVEGRRGGALLPVAADVEAVGVALP